VALLLLLVPLLAEGSLRALAGLSGRERGMTWDADLGWRMLPDVEKHGAFWGVDEPARTNSQGWRDAEHERRKPPGVFRIVALGDSFTFGVDADYGERFSEVLEQEVAGLEVVNLGVNAYGTAQELRLLETEGFDWQPDLVLLMAFLGNDMDDIRARWRGSWPSPWYRLDGGRLSLQPPVASWDVRLRSASYLAEVLLSLVGPERPGTQCAPPWCDADTVPLFAALVARMNELCEQRGAGFLVVLAYPSERLESAPLAREGRALEALRAAGLRPLDLHQPFAEQHAAGLELFRGGVGHWGPEGNRLVAHEIERRLRADGLLP